ncbi:MAG TPA: GNAT family N-acetyltransferase [Actinomycetota bacterium]|nr:GNAT family N-acetyltransferase [Actinomycetota bacterium]
MTVLQITDPRWIAFTRDHPDATAFHHPEWARLVADCYGFRPFAVATLDPSGLPIAGLPFVRVRHVGGKPRWVSLPFTDYLAPLASTPELQREVLEAARTGSRTDGDVRIEIRAPLSKVLLTNPPAWRHVLRLDPDPDVVYKGFHRSQVQRSIRKAERAGLHVRIGTSREDLLGTFYDLHLRTRRRQGVPIQPRHFFELLWERFLSVGLGELVIVEASQRAMAAAVFLAWNRTVIYKFGASDENSWSMRPNHALMWHAIRHGCELGYRWFDFGRTDAGNDGLRAFKLSWGAREEPLAYCVLGREVSNTEPRNGIAGRALGAAIRHGPPLLCRVTGELLYRYVA